jgi:hypothetical protein
MDIFIGIIKNMLEVDKEIDKQANVLIQNMKKLLW